MCSILIIENERSIRQALRLYLERLDHKVYCTGSFSEGVWLVKACKLDLVIIDGDTLNKNNLSELKTNGTPMLLLLDYTSSNCTKITSTQILTITKPFTLKLFNAKIRKLITNERF